MRPVTQRTANQLLHNKFVVVLGDSIQNHSWRTATSSAPTRHQGPAWTQAQMMRQFSGFGSQLNSYGSQFYSDSVPPHSTAGYQRFEREPFNRGANNSAAAPYWPVNNLVMRHKQRRPYNPYTRERLRTLTDTNSTEFLLRMAVI